jgi:hypothetical protein
MNIEFTRTTPPGRKYRVHQWIDTKTFEPMYGIQQNVTHGRWAHVVVGNSPALFKTQEEAEEQIRLWSRPVQS